MKKIITLIACTRNRFDFWNSCKRLQNVVNVEALYDTLMKNCFKDWIQSRQHPCSQTFKEVDSKITLRCTCINLLTDRVARKSDCYMRPPKSQTSLRISVVLISSLFFSSKSIMAKLYLLRAKFQNSS